MGKTATMKLIELMILKDDIDLVLEFLGKRGNFQFQDLPKENIHNTQNPSGEIFQKVLEAKNYLCIGEIDSYSPDSKNPTKEDFDLASKILEELEDLKNKEIATLEEEKKVKDAYQEALAFANLKVSYSELEHLSFLSMRIGKIDPAVFEELKFACGERAVIVPLGEDKTRILAASSKKGRFALDTELKRFGFVGLEIPSDFKGIPDDVLESLKNQCSEVEQNVSKLKLEKENYKNLHKTEIIRLLGNFSIGKQIHDIKEKLEATQLVYRITGWIPASDSDTVMKDLDELTEGRVAIRGYEPKEVPSVTEGHEKVPVKLKHGKFVSSFERMIFSYGSPVYGTIDPTPFVAFFFTLLFGIMFGDLGQGLVFVIVGILLTKHWIR